MMVQGVVSVELLYSDLLLPRLELIFRELSCLDGLIMGTRGLALL
jgi:hypothetical protein